MEKINLNDLQKRKLNRCYVSWSIITKEIYIRNNEACKEKKMLYIILGTDISGNRQVLASLFEDKYNNRFWLEYFESIKARGAESLLFAVIPQNRNLERCLKIVYTNVHIIHSPEEIIVDVTRFFTEKSTRKFITNLKDLFFAKTLEDHNIEVEMFREQFSNNKVVLMLLDRYDKIEVSKFNENERRTVIYYADPYSSWQKGMNENCNGILRRFIPKGTDLNKISIEKLEKILNKINGKPRKILGFISSDKRFKEEIEKIVA